MATPKIHENCYHVQNDPRKCKIKLEKFHFDISCRFGVIKESLPGGAESAPPPGEIGLNSQLTNENEIVVGHFYLLQKTSFIYNAEI